VKLQKGGEGFSLWQSKLQENS